MSDLPNAFTKTRTSASPLDAAKALTPRWMQNIRDFDALEIHPCEVIGTDSQDNEIVEQCAPEHAHFWSVFGHLRTGGTDDFEDFATKAEAIAFHDRLIAAYPHLAGGTENHRLIAAKGDSHASTL